MPSLERLLAPVPPATHAQTGLRADQKWSAEFNVACWARGRTAESATVTLVLRYRDAAGERQAAVDKASCGKESSLLLSGRVVVQATGKIDEMTVWLVSEPACEVFVDELYCQRVGASATAKPLLAVR